MNNDEVQNILDLLTTAVAAKLSAWDAMREMETQLGQGDSSNMDELISAAAASVDNAAQLTKNDASEFVSRLRFE